MTPASRRRLGDRLSGRVGYLAASLAAFAGQHVAVIVLLAVRAGPHVALPWWFVFSPLRLLLVAGDAARPPGAAILALGMLATLAVDAALAGLALRRARRLRAGAWAATLVIVPGLQLAAIAWLALAPEESAEADPERARAALDARTVVVAVLGGVGLIVLTVALSTLVFGLYGYTLFLLSPFLIAAVIGWLANRRGPTGFPRTLGLTALAFLLGAAALMGFAFEGAVCLVLAFPIIAIVGVLGAAAGEALAGLGRRGRGAALSGVAFIPVLLVAEAALPPRPAFDDVQAVEIAAPPSAVWRAVTRMTPIDAPPPAGFRWGLAYPVSGVIAGEGVGAVRRSVFSTGEAYERVTAWAPGRRLAFAVLSEPPAMRELSPYRRVNAPHASGYFRTTEVTFTFDALPGGGTRLSLASRHALDLEPALYWTPLAQWAVRANKMRVLAHLRRQAEAGARA